MTIQEIKNTPEIVDFMLDKSVIADSRMKLHKRLEEICELAIKPLEQQPCEDCISRQEAINCVTLNEFRYKIAEDMKTLPSVVPKEKTGKWYSTTIQGQIDGQIVKAFVCSECGAISVFRLVDGEIVNGDLCPNCGAKMVEP